MSFISWLKSVNPFKSKAAAEKPQLLFGRIPLEQVAPKTETLTENTPGFTQEEEAKHLAIDQIDAYLNFGQWLPVQSSNVDEIHYDPDQSQLQVRFKNGGVYQYEGVSYREAEGFARSLSPGGWVWSNLRVRGKGNFWAFRKPYVFISGVSNYAPQWLRSAKIRKLHGRVAEHGRVETKTGKVLGMSPKKLRQLLAPRWGRAST